MRIRYWRDITLMLLTPWIVSASIVFGMRGQWLGVLGCCLMGGAAAALALDTVLWRGALHKKRDARDEQNSRQDEVAR